MEACGQPPLTLRCDCAHSLLCRSSIGACRIYGLLRRVDLGLGGVCAASSVNRGSCVMHITIHSRVTLGFLEVSTLMEVRTEPIKFSFLKYDNNMIAANNWDGSEVVVSAVEAPKIGHLGCKP